MASTGPVVDPLTSKDGTPATVQTVRNDGQIKTNDEQLLEQVQAIREGIEKIVSLLQWEFDQQIEDFNSES